MNTDDRALLTAIAVTMKAEAARRRACREMPGGLIVELSKTGTGYILKLTSPHPGPTLAQREDWRAAFRVPAWAFEFKDPLDNYVVVGVEWEEVSQALDSGKVAVR